MRGDRSLVPFNDAVEDSARIVQRQIASQARDAVAFIDEIATSKRKISVMQFAKRLDRFAREFDGGFSGTKASKGVRGQVRESMYVGGDTFSSRGTLQRLPGKFDVADSFAERINYYADSYYERIVAPRLLKAFDPSKDAAVMKRELKQLTRSLLTDRLPYWENVTNSGVSYAYNYGYLKTAQANNHRKLMYVAVLDERTTAFCRKIDGKTIKLDVVLENCEGLAEEHGEDVERNQYWKAAAKLKNPTISGMKKLGILTPPFHGNCRTILHAF